MSNLLEAFYNFLKQWCRLSAGRILSVEPGPMAELSAIFVYGERLDGPVDGQSSYLCVSLDFLGHQPSKTQTLL